VFAANAFGCEGEVLASVLNESNLTIDLVERNDVSCTWFDNGSVVARANGAVEPLNFVLNGLETSSTGSFDQLAAGQYDVAVEDAAGCTASATFELDYNYANMGEDCPCSVYVPNAITPDGDLVNEVLKLQASCPVSDFHIEVFDRWGRLVFESFDTEFQWHGGYEGDDTYNGYYVQNTVYHYRLTYKWGTDQGISINTETQLGWVSVLR
jgi:gliding motility-associated-like protein